MTEKEKIYGDYADQRVAISTMVEALDRLKRQYQRLNNQEETGLTKEERVDYTIISLKITRSVTAIGDEAIDSYLDLANYSRLACRATCGVDILDDLCKG